MEEEKLRRWFKGNEDAVEFILLLGELTQIIDDFADGDAPAAAPPRQELAARMTYLAMFAVPGNMFYVEHRAMLDPVLFTGFSQWDMSNKLARATTLKSRQFAFVYREACEQMIVMCAQLIGGFAWSRQVALEMHRFFHVERNPETFEDWEITV